MNLKEELKKYRIECPSCLDDAEDVIRDYDVEHIAESYAKEKAWEMVVTFEELALGESLEENHRKSLHKIFLKKWEEEQK